jgi:hypothetical protein
MNAKPDYITRNALALAMSIYRGTSCEESTRFCGVKPSRIANATKDDSEIEDSELEEIAL